MRSICNLLHFRDRRKYIKVLDINELDELEQVQREEDLNEFCFSCAWHGMVCVSIGAVCIDLLFTAESRDDWKEGLVMEAVYPNVCFCSEMLGLLNLGYDMNHILNSTKFQNYDNAIHIA